MKGGNATNGTLNVARPGRPGNAGLVKEGCPGSEVVRAYDTNVPQQWNERRWSRTQKTFCSFFWSGVSVYDHEKYALRQGEMCISPPASSVVKTSCSARMPRLQAH